MGCNLTVFIYSIAPDDAATVTELNTKQITLNFVDGTHMVPNETPDILGKVHAYLCMIFCKTMNNNADQLFIHSARNHEVDQ
jgi:hypothetical protein